MATFISMISYTQQGIAAIKESPKRLDQAREAFEALGVSITDVYLTMGDHDLMIITEAPDGQAVAKTLLMIGSMGNVSTTTVEAFDEDAMREIVGSLM